MLVQISFENKTLLGFLEMGSFITLIYSIKYNAEIRLKNHNKIFLNKGPQIPINKK